MSDYFLLYAGPSSETGPVLGQKCKDLGLDIEWGSSVNRHYKGVVRWGATSSINPKPDKVVQYQAAIKKATDKLQALIDMKNAGVRVPAIYSGASDVKFPALGRQRQHSHGSDIVPVVQRADIAIATSKGCEFFVEYIPTATEYRIHVWDGKVIKSSEKKLTDPSKHHPFIRNLEYGCTFRVPDQKVRATTKYLAVAAVEVLGLKFGAVDVIEGDDGYAYFLEVNTSPGLTVDSSVEAYANKIIEEFA